MGQYIAFLRGINVGGHRVTMDRLRSLFEELGLSEVSTVLASGNVIFSAECENVDALRDAIEHQLAQALGYEVPAFIRSRTQVAEIAAVDPPTATTETASPSSHYVILLHVPPSESLRSEIAALASAMDAFQFLQTEIHWRIRGKLTDSPLLDQGMDRATRGTPTTMRNMSTLRRVVAKMEARDAT